MIPTFASLDEASHHLYLADEAGPILCVVDGSTWKVWRDGSSLLVSETVAA